MRVLYILSHHDDELGAWPLIRGYALSGAEQTFVYLTDCAVAGADPLDRQRETVRTLQACGIAEPDCRFVGYDHDIPTYHLPQHLPRARALLSSVIASVKPDVIVTHAWEGGHVDHDCAYALACDLRRDPTAAYQFALYNMRGLRWPIFRGANPIPENGPRVKASMQWRDWLSYLVSPRHHPSQWRVFLFLWPAVVLTFMLRGGFHYQRIGAPRVGARPHIGPLMYEQEGRGTFEGVQRAIRECLGGPLLGGSR